MTNCDAHMNPSQKYLLCCVAEWLKLKLSGQQCEPLELDKEDRMRIEEIKRELLLLNPIRVSSQDKIFDVSIITVKTVAL